jgi:hypothetical protein
VALRAQPHAWRKYDGAVRGWFVADRLFEVSQTIADSFAELRQLAWSEDHQHDDQDDDEVPRL